MDCSNPPKGLIARIGTLEPWRFCNPPTCRNFSGRERPLFAESFLELGLKERRLHAAVDGCSPPDGSAASLVRSRKM